ncbi:MAG: ACT domain-containing protein, partial [Chthoniobacterales bacterium]
RMSQEAEIPTRIFVDNRGHPSFTIVDIQTPDRIGLLYELFGALADLGLSLELARITTEREVALDTFYVYRSSDGAKLSGEDEIRDLQRALHKAATGTAEAVS